MNHISRNIAIRTSQQFLLINHARGSFNNTFHCIVRQFSTSAPLGAKKQKRNTKLETLERKPAQSNAETRTITSPTQSQFDESSLGSMEDDLYKIEVINFPTTADTGGVGGVEGGEAASITERQADIIQSSVDKLAKKYDKLSENVHFLNDALSIMSASVQMLAEQHINQRVISILRQAKLVAPQTQAQVQAAGSGAGETQSSGHIPFVRLNNEQRIEDFLRLFVRDCGVVGAEQAVRQSVKKQSFIDFEGHVSTYGESAMASSNWITTPMGGSKGGRHRKMISGEVTVIGTSTSIARALHRAMRIPVLLKRYTSRIHKALYRSTTSESMEGMEGVTVFVITGSLHPSDICIPPRFFNRVISSAADFDQLEDNILQTFEGELAMPDDEEVLESEYMLNSDPLRDATGVWKLFHETEWNGMPYQEIPSDVKDKIALLVLLRIARLCKFNVFFGSVLNPLG